MKNVIKSGLMLVAAGLMFTSCEKSENQPSTASAVNSGDKMIDLNQVANYLTAEGYLTATEDGNGSIFVAPGQNGSAFLIFKNDPVTGLAGGLFGADYGPNDFWRENPDGTVSVQLSSQTAELNYFAGGDSYAGTGNMHMIFTGELLVINLPFPPFELRLVIPGGRGAVDMMGVGKVTLDGLPGAEHNLRGQIKTSASGQSNNKLEFN